ncbi:MAG: ATP-binding protein [Firmicutes bacterium]|mgnify:CR=1 FL=1|nr:ATP-binding protein [Bacillota bacterium]
MDARDLRQVIYNLVRNGLEAMKKGGRVSIRTYQCGKAVLLEIADTGGGIPREVMDDLGEPFVTTKKFAAGLGLAVSIRILQRYHAGITVQSSPHGTTFTIAFPLPDNN